MIERYSDHAANERTFLASFRRAIAVMAFGFLVEGSTCSSRSPAALSERRRLAGRLVGGVAGWS